MAVPWRPAVNAAGEQAHRRGPAEELRQGDAEDVLEQQEHRDQKGEDHEGRPPAFRSLTRALRPMVVKKYTRSTSRMCSSNTPGSRWPDKGPTTRRQTTTRRSPAPECCIRGARRPLVEGLAHEQHENPQGGGEKRPDEQDAVGLQLDHVFRRCPSCCCQRSAVMMASRIARTRRNTSNGGIAGPQSGCAGHEPCQCLRPSV